MNIVSTTLIRLEEDLAAILYVLYVEYVGVCVCLVMLYSDNGFKNIIISKLNFYFCHKIYFQFYLHQIYL